jgi:hypothetical protein
LFRRQGFEPVEHLRVVYLSGRGSRGDRGGNDRRTRLGFRGGNSLFLEQAEPFPRCCVVALGWAAD